MKIFPSEDCKDIDWKMESVTFPRFIKMLTFTPYTDNLLRGIIFSVGGVTESLVKYSSFSLFSYLKEIDEDTLKDLTNKILNVCEESHKNERMIISILAFLDRLLSSGSIQIILDNNESEIPLRMLCLLKKEMKVMHNTAMTTSSIKIICQLLQVFTIIIIVLIILINFFFNLVAANFIFVPLLILKFVTFYCR